VDQDAVLVLEDVELARDGAKRGVEQLGRVVEVAHHERRLVGEPHRAVVQLHVRGRHARVEEGDDAEPDEGGGGDGGGRDGDRTAPQRLHS